jgi:hypothetical protein
VVRAAGGPDSGVYTSCTCLFTRWKLYNVSSEHKGGGRLARLPFFNAHFLCPSPFVPIPSSSKFLLRPRTFLVQNFLQMSGYYGQDGRFYSYPQGNSYPQTGTGYAQHPGNPGPQQPPVYLQGARVGGPTAPGPYATANTTNLAPAYQPIPQQVPPAAGDFGKLLPVTEPPYSLSARALLEIASPYLGVKLSGQVRDSSLSNANYSNINQLQPLTYLPR